MYLCFCVESWASTSGTVVNLNEETLMSRLVYDEIIASGDNISKMPIPAELSPSCQLAHKKYIDGMICEFSMVMGMHALKQTTITVY